MAVRDDFSAGEVLAAADLNDTFGSKLPYSYGTATPSTSVDGFLWYDENDTPPTPKFWDGAAFQALGGGGKILQVVRATDSTNRTTTSTSAVDANISVTITPQKSTSAVILMWSFRADTNASSQQGIFSITDSSNNAVSGAGYGVIGFGARVQATMLLIGYATPATTSAVTYKGRFYSPFGGSLDIDNSSGGTGQMYAIEVAA